MATATEQGGSSTVAVDGSRRSTVVTVLVVLAAIMVGLMLAVGAMAALLGLSSSSPS